MTKTLLLLVLSGIVLSACGVVEAPLTEAEIQSLVDEAVATAVADLKAGLLLLGVEGPIGPRGLTGPQGPQGEYGPESTDADFRIDNLDSKIRRLERCTSDLALSTITNLIVVC